MKVFARELRTHCARRGSIAQLCKATGINRQQFNKYLAGQMMPGVRTLRKICTYLEVTEAELMAGKSLAHPANDLADPRVKLPLVLPMLRDVASKVPPPTAPLVNGLYHCYLPVNGWPRLVARWLVHVAAGPLGQVFTSRLRVCDPLVLGYPAGHMHFGGPVIYGMDEAMLFGPGRAPLRQSGILLIDTRPLAGGDHFSAMVLSRRPAGAVAMTGVLAFLGAEAAPRQALAAVGVIPIDDPSLDPLAARIMRTLPVAGANWMLSLNPQDLRPDVPAAGLILPSREMRNRAL